MTITPRRFAPAAAVATAVLVLSLAAAPAQAATARPASAPGLVDQAIAWLAQILASPASAAPAADTSCPTVNGRPTCASNDAILISTRGNRGCAIDPIGGMLTC
jgi:hypothetical protein